MQFTIAENKQNIKLSKHKKNALKMQAQERKEIGHLNSFNYHRYRSNVKLSIQKIDKIVNVYQPYYKFSNRNASGFGDFIRGCYFLLVYCDTTGMAFDMIINHPINSHLIGHNISSQQHNGDLVQVYNEQNLLTTHTNENKLVTHFLTPQMFENLHRHLQTCYYYNKTAFIYTTGFPPLNKISKVHINRMRTILSPNKNMNYLLKNTLSSLNLEKKKFQVMHIRCGDIYLTSNDNQVLINERLIENIINWYENIPKKSENILLVTDNAPIKDILKNNFPEVLYIDTPICHSGEGNGMKETDASFTMLDFYLMSFACVIHSFTTNGHGSGFSQWCAFTYDIPYTCTIHTGHQ